MQGPDLNQRSRAYETRGDDRTPLPCVSGTPGRTRTFSLWFWRPLRCQLRYRDIFRLPFRQHSQRPAFTGLARCMDATPLRSGTHTFQPGPRDPRDGFFTNTDKMERPLPLWLHSGRCGTAPLHRAQQFVPTPSHDTKLLMNALFGFDDLKNKKPGPVACVRVQGKQIPLGQLNATSTRTERCFKGVPLNPLRELL